MPSRFPVLRRGTEWEGLTRDEIVAIVVESFAGLLLGNLSDVDTTGVQDSWTIQWSEDSQSWGVGAGVDGGAGVLSVNGMSGIVTLDAADVGAATAAEGELATTAVQPSSLATAISAALTGYQALSQRDAASGYAGLNSDGKLATSTLPTLAITDSFPVESQAEMLALTAQRGDIAIRSDLPASFVLAGDDPTDLADWLQLPSGIGSVLSVNGQTDVVVLVAADVGAATSAQGDTADSALQPGDPISSVVWTDSLGNFGAQDAQYDGQTTIELVLDGIATVIQEVINAALAVDGNLADVADPAAALANIGGLTESQITGLVTAAIDALLDGAPRRSTRSTSSPRRSPTTRRSLRRSPRRSRPVSPSTRT